MQASSSHPAVNPASLRPSVGHAEAAHAKDAVEEGHRITRRPSSSTRSAGENPQEGITSSGTPPTPLPLPMGVPHSEGHCSHRAPEATSSQAAGAAAAMVTSAAVVLPVVISAAVVKPAPVVTSSAVVADAAEPSEAAGMAALASSAQEQAIPHDDADRAEPGTYGTSGSDQMQLVRRSDQATVRSLSLQPQPHSVFGPPLPYKLILLENWI